MAFYINDRIDPHTTGEVFSRVRPMHPLHKVPGMRTGTSSPNLTTRDENAIESLLQDLKASSAFLHRKLKFSINKELNRVIIKVIDAETDKVIKELPPEELQRVSIRIREAVGLLIDEEI